MLAAVEEHYLRDDLKQRFAESHAAARSAMCRSRAGHRTIAARSAIAGQRPENRYRVRRRSWRRSSTRFRMGRSKIQIDHGQRNAGANRDSAAIGAGTRPLAIGRVEARARRIAVSPAQQIEELSTKWLASVPPERLENVQQRLQSPNGKKSGCRRHRPAEQSEVKAMRQPIMWLLRSFPSPAGDRGNRGAGQSGSAGKSAAKAVNHPTDDADN